MTNGTTYVLDANVFIEAARRYYAFDIVPKFWDTLVQNTENEQILSIDRVKQELELGKDVLATWAKGHFSHAFASTDEQDIIQSYAEIMAWVQAQAQYSDAAKAYFAKGADGWLVAYARVKRRVVVTHEVLAPDARSRVPLPNVCQAFGVPFVDTFEMLRTLGIRLA